MPMRWNMSATCRSATSVSYTHLAADAGARAQGDYADGVYVGHGRGMEGAITVTLLLDDGRITCLETTQEGESQSRGGYEAIRDGRYAEMIEAAQSADILSLIHI